MSEQPVIIPCEESFLIADLSRGGTDGALLLPGWGGTRYGPQRILWQAAAALGARGLTTLRLDLRGRGDSPGNPVSVTLDEMIADALAAAEWLHVECGVTRLHLVGLCSGGNVALGAASRCAHVGDVVCWSLLPFMEHKTQAVCQGTPRGKLLSELVRKALRPETWMKLLRGEANVRGAMKTLAADKEGDAEERRRKTSARDILADLREFDGALHLLYGSADPEAVGSRAFFEEWRCRHHISGATQVIHGAPHNFYTAQWTQQVIAQTVEWLVPASVQNGNAR